MSKKTLKSIKPAGVPRVGHPASSTYIKDPSGKAKGQVPKMSNPPPPPEKK